MSIRRSLAWAYGSQALTLVVNFAGSIALARLLSPREMGVFAFAMAMAGLIGVFTSLNLQSYIVREGVLDHHAVRTTFTLNALSSLSLAIVMLAIAAFEYVAAERDIAAVLAISALPPAIGIFEFVPSALYQRELNYSLLSRLGIARTVLVTTVTVGCAAIGLGSLSPAIGPVAGSLLGAGFLSMRRRRDLVLTPTFKGLRPTLVFAFQIMSVSGVGQITHRLSDIVLARMLGLGALGLYARASNLSNIMWSNIYGMATGIVFAKLSKDLRETGSLHATFVVSIRMLTGLLWPLIAGLGILAGPFIHTVYGPKWSAAAPVLSLLMASQFVALAFGMNWELFVLRQEMARPTRFEIARAVVGLGFTAIGSLFSIIAVAGAQVAESLVGYLLYRPHIDRLAGTDEGELEQVFGESLALTAIAVAPSLLLMIVTRFAADTSLVQVAATVSLGIAGWFVALVVRRHPILAEIRLAVSRLRALRLAA